MNGGAQETHDGGLFAGELQRAVIVFSIGWLAAANMVGVWLALLLVRPTWGALFGEWTYGRWMALHLNWQLYGWCSLPMVGLLLKRYAHPSQLGVRQTYWALALWSLALGLGGVSWLQGETSGKLFLDWAGLPRLLFTATLLFLWCLLAWNAVRFPVDANPAREGAPGRSRAVDLTLLLALAFVPVALYWSSERRVYPAFDPGTGGPTGASLLGSTLVIVLVLAWVPKLLGLARSQGRSETGFWIWFCGDTAIFFLLGHGSGSHRQWQQIVGLGSLLTWIPLLAWHLRQFSWNPASRPWLAATLWWWVALVSSGFASFLPGLLDRIKFTHALVAHAHLAMAGLLTSLNMLILLNLSAPMSEAGSSLVSRGAFLGWHGGLLLQIAALFWLARIEVESPGQLFSGDGGIGYIVRLVGGLLMATASMYWITQAVGRGVVAGRRVDDDRGMVTP